MDYTGTYDLVEYKLLKGCHSKETEMWLTCETHRCRIH